MRFRVKSSIWVEEEMIQVYPWLKDYGLESVGPDEHYITVNTIDELMDISKRLSTIREYYGVILFSTWEDYDLENRARVNLDQPTLELYDGCRE